MAKPSASDAGSFSGTTFASDRLNEIHIKDHVPVILNLDSPSYNAWRTYFRYCSAPIVSLSTLTGASTTPT